MTTCLAIFALALVVSLGATLAVRAAALRLGVVDRPDHFRKIHQRDMPRLGGVAIFAAFTVPLLVLYYLRRTGIAVKLNEHPAEFAGLLLGGAVALGAGVIDDVRGLRPRWKFFLQAVAACIAVSAGFQIAAVCNPFGEPLRLGLLAFPVSVFWLLCCMNGVNLLDGLDGLAAGVCLCVCVTFFLVGMVSAQPLSMVLAACLSGAVLGFLVFNFHPASIFLGDSGSLLLGLLVGAISLLGAASAHGGVAQLIPVIALGLPLFDTALAVLRRWSHKLPLSAADRQHIHHTLLALGLSHRRVVLILYSACVLLGAAALLITFEQVEVTLLVLGSLGVVGFVCARLFGRVRFVDLWSRISDDLSSRQRSAAAKVSLERAVVRLRAASSLDELWDAASQAIAHLGFDCATLRLCDSPHASPRRFAWPNSEREARALMELEPDVWSARLRILTAGDLFGELEATKAVQDGPLLPEAPELLDRVRREIAARLSHLGVEEIQPDRPAPVAAAPYESPLPRAQEAAH